MKMVYWEPVVGDALKLKDDQSKLSDTNIKLPEQLLSTIIFNSRGKPGIADLKP